MFVTKDRITLDFREGSEGTRILTMSFGPEGDSLNYEEVAEQLSTFVTAIFGYSIRLVPEVDGVCAACAEADEQQAMLEFMSAFGGTD